MATTTKAAAPAKKSGFQGVKAAWIILAICCACGYGVWYFVMGGRYGSANGWEQPC